MNKFKKIGLSALAGSLAAASAQAEISWSGSAVVTWMDDDTNYLAGNNGNGIGQNTNVTFTNSGELDNGWTVTAVGYMNDGNGGSVSSTNMKLGMGDMGTVVFAEAGGTASNGIDDVTPTAYEESWDLGNGTTYAHQFGAVTNSGAIEYQSPAFDMMGASVSVTAAYDPNGGTANRDHDAITDSSTSYESGTAYTAKIVWEGLTLGGGIEEVGGIGAAADYDSATGYAKYAMGGLTIGYQEAYHNMVNGAVDYEPEGWGATFAVNDDLTIGWQQMDDTKKALLGTAGLTQEFSAVSASYTTGGITIAVQQTDVDNVTHSSGNNQESTEISLSFAF